MGVGGREVVGEDVRLFVLSVKLSVQLDGGREGGSGGWG